MNSQRNAQQIQATARRVGIQTPKQLFDSIESMYWDFEPWEIEKLIFSGDHDLFNEYPTGAGIVYVDYLGYTDNPECQEKLAHWYHLDRVLEAGKSSSISS